MSINFTHLRSFYMVALAQSFSAAARRLNISQSTLTRQVSLLEEDYKTRLFERTTRRVELTQEGHQLLEYCTPIFSHMADVESFLKAQTARRVSVHAVHNSAVSDLVAMIVTAFPKLRCDVKIDRSKPVLNSLLERKCDFGILTIEEDQDELEYAKIKSERLRPLIAQQDYKGGAQEMFVKDLEGKKVIVSSSLGRSRDLFDRTVALKGVKVLSIIEVDSNEVIWDLVQKGVGIGVIASTGLIEKAVLQEVHFKDADLEISVHLACRKDRLRTEPFRLIFEMAQKRFATDHSLGWFE